MLYEAVVPSAFALGTSSGEELYLIVALLWSMLCSVVYFSTVQCAVQLGHIVVQCSAVLCNAV